VDEATRTSGSEVTDGQQEQRSPEEIRADIEETRRDLGDTVEELAAKTDVKAKAQAKADEVKRSAADKRVPIIAGVAIAIVAIILIRR
jgi:uncharacterized protein DUF3618